MHHKEKNPRIAAIGDLHLEKTQFSDDLFDSLEQDADLLLIAGDITNRGRLGEAKEFLRLLRNSTIPTVAVLGNHDCDSDNEAEITRILQKNGIRVVAGDVVTMEAAGLQVGITGTKGHGGGFAPHRGYARGEKSTKAYMQEEEQELQKFNQGIIQLNQMNLDVRIAMLHYSPYRETIAGEPPELFLFMGSSRFADELKRHPVDLIVHGHAHHGTGKLIKTREGIFACNVAQMLHQGKYCLFSISKTSDRKQDSVRLLNG